MFHLCEAFQTNVWFLEFFETLVVELLVMMGYRGSIAEAGIAIRKTGDEVIDSFIKEDQLDA
jgi:restriction system protein